jgi:hypothetical protein
MGDLNVPRAEADAIKAIDSDALGKLIGQCIYEEQTSAVRRLGLESCGPYISAKLRSFERALANHAKAKAAKKRAETEYDVRKAGRDMECAVQEMKARVAKEEQEGLLFYVDDHVAPPVLISQHLSVRISYRWRTSVDQDWKYGSVTFSHDVAFQRDYLAPVPTRKPSAAQQRRDREEDLYRQWNYLKMLGLGEVRDHFRRGGSGALIPETVQAKVDPHTHLMNNFSSRF